MAFMKDLEYECLQVGNSGQDAPQQGGSQSFELAPVYEEANLANDHNQLLMTIMDKIARRHPVPRAAARRNPSRGSTDRASTTTDRARPIRA